jgi:integrase
VLAHEEAVVIRRKGVEGSVRKVPGGSGTWQVRLPHRLDPHRRPLPGAFRTEAAAWRALRAAIGDMDRNAVLRPTGRPTGRVRRVKDVLEGYIVACQSSTLAPIAIRTVRDYRSVLGAALAWEVREGRLGMNPATHVRVETSKARRAAMQSADPVLLPSWAEFATLVETPEREHDRLLLALLGWCGLRWSEAVSLREQAVWRGRPQITIERVLVRRTQKEVDADTGLVLSDLDNRYWRQEPPKAGMTATVPLPMPAGRLLFHRPTNSPGHTRSIGVLDNTNFRRDVWIPAREAARLTGDESLPALDPRRYPMKVKDLRASAASVLLDSGSSLTEAVLLLRHSDKKTTERHYARAMQERAHDRARRDVQVDKGANIGERLDALWEAWVAAFHGVLPKLGMDVDNVIELESRRSVG